MSDQSQKIAGYRELNQQEIDLMNECKSLESRCVAIFGKLQDYVPANAADKSLDQRCVALAKTNLQQGFMWMIRSIAQPVGW